MLFCLGLSGRITQISNILCASASLREKSTDEFRVNVDNIVIVHKWQKRLVELQNPMWQERHRPCSKAEAASPHHIMHSWSCNCFKNMYLAIVNK